MKLGTNSLFLHSNGQRYRIVLGKDAISQKNEIYIFNGGTTSDYTGGWSVESGEEYLSKWKSENLSVGTTISAGLATALNDTSHTSINATTWITSDTIDFTGFNTITVATSRFILFDSNNTAEIAFYIDDKLIKSYTTSTSGSYLTDTFTADISSITSGKIRIKLYIVDYDTYYSSDAHIRVQSIKLS